MVAQQRDWNRFNYRVGEDTLIYQQLMDQEPEQYELEKRKREAAGGRPKLATNSLSQVL